MRAALDLGVLPDYLRAVVEEHAGGRVAVADGDVILPAGLVDDLGASVAAEVGRVLTRGRPTGVYRIPTPEDAEAQAATTGPNPWAKADFNLTQQAALMNDDPTRAALLRSVAETAGTLAPGSLKVPG